MPKVTEKLDYEAELVIVIGKEAKYVSKEDALGYVFGYSNVNDLSARDLAARTINGCSAEAMTSAAWTLLGDG